MTARHRFRIHLHSHARARRAVLAALCFLSSVFAAAAAAAPVPISDIVPQPGRVAGGGRTFGMSPAEIRQKLREAGLPSTPSTPRSRRSPPVAGPAPVAAAVSDLRRGEGHGGARSRPPASSRSATRSSVTRLPRSSRFFPTGGPGLPGGPRRRADAHALGDDQLTASLVVNREGYISVPEVGQVPSAGSRSRACVRDPQRAFGDLLAAPARAALDHFRRRLARQAALDPGVPARPGRASGRLHRELGGACAPCSLRRRRTTRAGTLRDMRLMRDGRLETSVDLYEVLLRGEASRDVRSRTAT